MYISYRPLITISFLFFTLSILNPVHALPLVGFFSEFFCFIGCLTLLPFLFKIKIEVPRIILPLFLILLIPLIQFSLGYVFFFFNAFFSFIYLLFFLLMIVLGYNLKINNIIDIKLFLAAFFLSISILSSFFAIIQWLGLSKDSGFIMNLVGSRPYANMAQPNHLATFLCTGLFSCWHFFENKKIGKGLFYVLCSIFYFSIALTQSRTAWLIILFSSIFLFLINKKYNMRISKINLLAGGTFFVLCIFILPLINEFIGQYFNIIDTGSIVERVSSGYERFKIWNQIFHAILQKPWFGYGWNQTTAAQFEVIDQFPGKEWATSSHNLILDILVWCGIPLGFLISSYFVYLYVRAYFSIEGVGDIFLFLVVSSVLIHSFLEFPLYFSYFLMPIGLIFGVLLKSENKFIFLNQILIVFIFFSSFFLGAVIFKEYLKIEDNLFSGRLHAMGDLRDEVKLPYHLYFFDFFDDRAKWLALYPKMKVSPEKLMLGEKMVKTYLKPYDIHKYAQLLAFNGYKDEADRQLKILNILYGIDVSYNDLLEK